MYGLLFFEYVLYFSFQYSSYAIFSEAWARVSWVAALGVAIADLLLIAVMIITTRVLPLNLRLTLKLAETFCFALLLCWSVANLDFAFFSVSYMMIVNLILIVLSIQLVGYISIIAHFFICCLLMLDVIVKSFKLSMWYYAVSVFIWQALRIFSLNYTTKIFLTLPIENIITCDFGLIIYFELLTRNKRREIRNLGTTASEEKKQIKLTP